MKLTLRRSLAALLAWSLCSPGAADAEPLAGGEPAIEVPATKPKKARRRRARRRRWPVQRPAKTPAPLRLPELGSIPFKPGERLVFSVEMFGVEAARCILGVGKPQIRGGRRLVPLKGWLRASPFLRKFYPLDDFLTTLVDERTFLPLRSDFIIQEKGKHLVYQSTFDQPGHTIRSLKLKKKPKGKTVRRSFRPLTPIHEALSAVYAARRMDLSVGRRFSFYYWDGRRERLVTVEVKKHEKVWTQLGWFDAARLELLTQVTGGFIKKKVLGRTRRGTAWIGLDPARTPIKVKTPTKLGDAVAILVRRYVDEKDAS